jgi:uncharacterized membrane protein
MRSFLLIISVFTLFLAKAQNTFEMYNNTDKEIYAAYAFYDFENKSWSTKGWYKIESYSTNTINLGSYSSFIYVHGFSVNPGSFWESETLNSWGKDVSLCVDKNNAFEIRYADKINCETKKTFSKYSINSGLNKWTFNP